MKLIRNIALLFRTVFQIAPLLSAVFVITTLLSGLFGPLQVFSTERLINAVGALLGGGAARGVWLYGGLLVVSVILQQLEGLLYQLIGSKRYAKLEKAIPLRMVDKLSRVSFAAFESPKEADLIERMGKGRAYAQVHNGFGRFIQGLASFVGIFGTVTMFFTANTYLGLGILALAVPIYALRIYTAFRRREQKTGNTMDERWTEAVGDLFSDKHALYEMHVFGFHERLHAIWKGGMQRVFSNYKASFRRIMVLEFCVQALQVLFVIYAVASLLMGFSGGGVSLGQLVSLIGALPMLFDRLRAAADDTSELMYVLLFMDDYRAFFDLPEEERCGGSISPVRRPDINFEHVSFAYPGTEREVLRDVHFMIPAGQRVALVGENGAGKSTIAKLLLGLYRPTRGRILVGGVELEALPDSQRKRLFSAVFQDIQSYELTLRENIALGDVDKLRADDALKKALTEANAAYLTEGSAKGLDMPLGRLEADGRDLSRGEWQRLAFARALLSGAEMVILDEPTAALDPIAESRMYQAYAQVLAGRGALMISHRLASARLAERILVLDGGHIVEDGSHDALIRRGGLYSRMYAAQSSWYTDEKEMIR